jgi:hypothetical protein
MSRNANDYASHIAALVTPGTYMAAALNSVKWLLYRGLGIEPARVDALFTTFLRERDPRNAVALLTDYERLLDIPGACNPTLGTVEQRQALAHSKFVAQGGMTPEYWIGVARDMGITIEIEEFPLATYSDFDTNNEYDTASYGGDEYEARYDDVDLLGYDEASYGVDGSWYQWIVTVKASNREHPTYDDAEYDEAAIQSNEAAFTCLLAQFQRAGRSVIVEYQIPEGH